MPRDLIRWSFMQVLDAHDETVGTPAAQAHRGARKVKERLQPALLDRLTDAAPEQRRESATLQVMSYAELRKAVLRDLRWLLNTANMESSHALEGFRHVASSTLNFGVRALAGKCMSEIDWSDMEMSLRQAIVTFEPRILPDRLEVRCVHDEAAMMNNNVLSFDIRGLLWCVPYPQEFLFRTDIDLESGTTDIREGEQW